MGSSVPPSMAVDEVTLPPLYAINQPTTSAVPPPLPPSTTAAVGGSTSSPQQQAEAAPVGPPAILPISVDHSMAAPQNPGALSPVGSTTSSILGAVNSPHEMDTINFEYTRHVLLKFLLSRDNEVSVQVSCSSSVEPIRASMQVYHH